MAFKVHDRVVVQSTINTPLGELKAGSLCTVMSPPTTGKSDEIIILRRGYDFQDRPVAIGAPVSLLREANEEELKDADHKTAVARNFWLGESHRAGHDTVLDTINPGDVGRIIDIVLKPNEMDDLLTLSFESTDHKFTRGFVENHFDKYDRELEEMYGDELDLKNKPRDYFLPGARMILNNKEIVIIKKTKEESLVVADMKHKEMEVLKEDLTPFMNIESFFHFTEQEKVQQKYLTGEVLVAKEDIEKHALLKKTIKANDKIEILHVDTQINVFEDVYQVVVNDGFSKPINVTYVDLERFFVHQPRKIQETEERECEHCNKEEHEEIIHEEPIDLSIFENKNDLEEKPVEEFSVPVIIHELTILGFRFKIDEETGSSFSIDNGKFYEFDRIEEMIAALNELKKLGRK